MRTLLYLTDKSLGFLKFKMKSEWYFLLQELSASSFAIHSDMVYAQSYCTWWYLPPLEQCYSSAIVVLRQVSEEWSKYPKTYWFGYLRTTHLPVSLPTSLPAVHVQYLVHSVVRIMVVYKGGRTRIEAWLGFSPVLYLGIRVLKCRATTFPFSCFRAYLSSSKARFNVIGKGYHQRFNSIW